MATSLSAIQAKLLEQERRGSGERTTTGDNASFPFWNAPEGTTSLLRFLPDADPQNTFFWVERQVIRLPFQGIVGQDDKQCFVQVPCIDMFGEKCPITEAIRPWWKDDSKKEMARVYYKKKSYLFQGFVVTSPIDEQNPPENPIRRFVINPSIYEIIKNSLMDPEMVDMPTDYTSGRDFRLIKTKKGDYANYATSQWSLKVRGLSDTESNAIATHGLFDLKTFLGARPDKEGVAIIKAMFDASLAGEPFDTASFGQHYRPFGAKGSGSSGSDAPWAETVQQQVATVTQMAKPSGGTPSAMDIIAKLNAQKRQ